MRENDDCDEHEDKQQETNATKSEKETNLKSDISGSRDILISGQNEQHLHNLPKTADFNLEEDFLETASLDCSSLSGYVENALLASANNTLDRGAKLSTLSLNSDEGEGHFSGSGTESEGRKSSLCVQYVTYDFIAAKSVSGLSSDGSSECFNSNESLNDHRKSEREEFVNSLLNKKNTNSNNNNSTLERYSNTTAAVDFGNGEQEESSSNLKEPQATFKTSDKHSSETSLNADDSIVKTSVDSTDGNPIVHLPHCPLSDENEDDEDMKAKKFLGLCLCQTAEVTDDESATELDFRNCNLKQVPIEIFQFTNTLQHLQLDSNTLSELPKALFSCTQLEYLTVSDNDLANLPSGLAGLTSLSYLDISKNVIEDVPDCIRCCKSLEVLDASVNPIERLSEGFTQLVGLKELYLNDCFLEFLPASFGRLIHLSVLELRDNQLQILPKSIKRLTMLKRLDLGGNVFQEWPDVISQLLKLNELWLDGNELNDVPPELGDLTNLVYLDISRNFVESIPSRLGSLTQLSDLLLCENHISKLPDTIGFLEKLNMLKCSMNQLTEIPNSVGKLHEIEELDLSHNKLETIPASIGNLKNMHTCLLDNNVLDSIPPEIGSCSKLKILQLSRNNLSSIPSKVGDLSELRVLNVCRNKLPHLPISVIKLAKLEALWVSSNQSKPNVPLHAEIAPNSKVRILTNILFPQTEEKPTIKMDEDGYAIDVADDNTSDVKKIRGVTRVAFNLELDIKNENDDEAMDHDTHVDVSANHIDDLIDAKKKPSSLTVKIMPEDDNKDESIEIATPTTPTKQHFHKHEEPKDDLELLHLRGPKISHHIEEKPPTNTLLEAEENLRKPKEKPSLPLLPPNSGVKLSVGDSPDGEPPQIPKIKTWSSRNNLPSAITDNNPDASKNEEISLDKLGDDIHFMDSDDNEAFDVRQSSNNNNKVSESSSNIRIDNSGNTRDWDARNVVSIPEDNKPHSNNQENDGPCPDWDSGVGNDVDSQESIPECQDEVESLPSSPASSNTATKPSSSTVSKPVSHPVAEKPKISPKKLPVPSQSSITMTDKKSSGSVFENIKKFETYTNKENESKSANKNTNVTPTSVNQNRKTPEEKAVIRPNNHLSKQPLKTSAFDNAKTKPMKHFDNKSDVLIKETNQNEVIFSSEDNADLFTFSKIEQTDKTNKKQPESKRKLPDAPPQETKHQIFRDRLEKIMQQQRNVAMQASQAAQNISQSEMIMTYSRKSSLSAISGNEADPEAKGLENLTAETSFPDDEQAPASPTKKGPPVYERMKNRLSERKPSQAPSSKIISRSRPGSAPATQLQRRGSSQRSSISALEGEDKRTLSALGTNDNKNNLNQRARSKSIEQQLGQLLLTDSDDAREELASHHRARNDRHDPRNDDRLRTNMLSNSAKFGVGGSRSSLVSPPPVRHNMYAKQRSSTNPPPVSDWKYKLLQHIERKRQEKTEVETRDRYMNRQSIGKIKSPPKTNVPHHHQQAHYDHDNRYYTSNYDNQPIYADPYKRGMSKSVTAPAIGHQPKPTQQLPRSHSNSSSNKPNHIKPPKHRTFTPGPEHSSAFNEAVVQPQVSRPKSAMEKYSPSVGNADPHFHNPNNDLPSYKDHLERHKARESHQIIPRHLESDLRQPQQKFNGGFPLRPTGSHDSLMDNYSRYDKPAQPANYYHDTPIRTTNSHDSILDQVGQSNYYDPYQEQHHLLPTKLQYRAPPTVPTQQQQYHVQPQYKPQPAQYSQQVPHHKPSKPKHQDYTSPDHATYVNVMSYQQQQPPPSGIPHHQHTHGNPHGHGKTPPSYNQYKQHHNQYYNKPLPAEPPTYNPVPNYRNPPQPQHHQRHNHQYAAGKETHVIYKEEESVASAFRPYNQGKPLIPRQPPSYQPPPPIEQSRHRQHHRTPSGGPHSYSNYMETQNHRRSSPPLQQQHSWENEYEMITVSIRRNPTFGFHVMGGVGAGGNPYTANDDGVFITHVTPGGPAEGKLQPGDKIILVNGSKFVGISHTRAVDMLRNAGHAAVLVVERSLGKAV